MNICVFCGSSAGASPVYAAAAKQLAFLFAKANITLVYGGGNVGLMGIVADEVLKHNGEVIGVIPDFLVRREVAHRGVTQLEVVSSMHERKKRMADLADAFIALPGGWGTLDELAEILTWRQLQLISQPIGILNTNSFFDPLIAQMEKMAAEGFLKKENLSQLKVGNDSKELLTALGVLHI
jgi:uncharacterized protein (TIGR00730 family)